MVNGSRRGIKTHKYLHVLYGKVQHLPQFFHFRGSQRLFVAKAGSGLLNMPLQHLIAPLLQPRNPVKIIRNSLFYVIGLAMLKYINIFNGITRRFFQFMRCYGIFNFAACGYCLRRDISDTKVIALRRNRKNCYRKRSQSINDNRNKTVIASFFVLLSQ